MTSIPTRQDGTVLAGVKAKPFGWPAASLDPRLRRLPLSSGREQALQEQIPLSHISTVSGHCHCVVMTGPRGSMSFSKEGIRTWMIDLFYLFDAHLLLDELRVGNVNSIRKDQWSAAEIFPIRTAPP